MRILSLSAVFILILSLSLNSQVKGDSATAAGGNFKNTSSRHFWMGKNYRTEWNTPITVPLFNFSTEKGGLTPKKKGGGKQTKSLRVEDKNGREYVLRSITKYITPQTLPGDLQSDAAADLVADGISASYPYAALSVTVLAEAAGIPHGNPKLFYITDDPALGEYRTDFANMLVMFEERIPDTVNKAFDSEEIIEKLQKDNDNNVDQYALLKIRILDMFVMDLDRHEGQWTWGSYDRGKGKIYYPVAKDRDQAFYINQGLLPGFVKGRSLVPQLEGFKVQANNIDRFNFAARNFDRFFLTQLSESDWKTAVDNFLAAMTDEVIDRAIAAQPAEIRNISGGKIAQTLKERRKYLAAEVMEYYRFLSEIVSVTGSDKKELFDITKNADGSLLVQVFKVDKDGGQSVKMYERKFDPLVTKEVRLYGLDGDDKFNFTGDNDRIKVRVIGGNGQDAFVNASKTSPEVLIYDRTDQNNSVEGAFKNRMSNKDTAVNSFNWLYYKYPYQSIFVNAGFNPDDGIFIGPTFKYLRHGFRKEPYKSMHQFKGLYAFSTQALNLQYNNEFISVFGKKTDIITEITYKGPNNTTNFFGYGMGSVYDKNQDGRFRFYRIRYDLGDITLQVRHRFSQKVTLAIGPEFQFYHYDSTDKFNRKRNIELNNPLMNATFDKRQRYFGGKLDLFVDTRDHQALPSKGITWNTTLRYLGGANDNSYDNVTILNSDFAFYVSLVKDWLVWANRIGGGVTGGENGTGFEFFHAQYLGSDDNLRGYRKQRWAGNSKFYNQTELRLKLANLKTYLFPASFGMFAFVDAGRVWVKNDNVDDFAVGYGGGLWIAPLRRLVIAVSVGLSDEDTIPLVGLSWRF